MKQLKVWLCLICLMSTTAVLAEDGVGQTIQIYTRLNSYVGTPSWLLEIRDIDHGQTIPYVFDFISGDNFWVAMTYGRNYLISASTLQFSPYRSNPFYTTRSIHDFCHIESHGKIIRGESMYITINGNLSPNTERFNCSVSRFPDNHFTVPTPDSDN